MTRLRKFVLGLLWVVPFVYGLAIISFSPYVFRMLTAPGYGSLDEPGYQPLSLLVRALLVILGFTPIALCVTSMMSVIQYHRRKKSARVWVIACGIVFLTSSIPLIVAGVELARSAGVFASGLAGFLLLPTIHLVVGILVLSLFLPRGSLGVELLAEAHLPRVKGDGTGPFSYVLLAVFLIAGFWFIDSVAHNWARQQGLERTNGFLADQLTFLVALFIATALHELGHVAAGLSVGMKLLSVRIGPFHMEIKKGRWRLVAPTSWKCLFQGGVRIIPASPQAYRKSHAIWTAAGGPLASLLVGGITLLFLLSAKGSIYESAWELMSLVTSLCLLFFLANLVPVRETAYSDGARIYQILTCHVMEDYRRVLAMSEASGISLTRPLDYDIVVIERAASNDALNPHLIVFLHLVTSDYYFDHEEFGRAAIALNKAEIVLDAMPIVWKENCDGLVLRAVSFLQNREMAEKWWQRGLNAKRYDPTRDGEFHSLAYCIIENRLSEAEQIWQSESERTNKLPNNGERVFDQHYLGRLRKLLDEAIASADASSRGALAVANAELTSE